MADEEGPSPQEMVEQVCSFFGQDVYLAQSVAQPITVDSMGQVVALECVKPAEFEQFMTMMGAQAGIESRDFLGHRIFTMDMSSMMGGPMPGMTVPSQSIGIGGGFAFLGNTASVEQALRGVGEDAGASLADNPQYQRAVAALQSDAAVAWGYSDSISLMEGQIKVAMLQWEAMMDEFDAEDPEIAAELGGMDALGMGPMFSWMEQLDFDVLREHLGPSSFEALATDDGFVIRSYMLDAGGE
jgi:hypothetical protein